MSLLITVILIIFALALLWLIYNLVWGTPPTIKLAAERLGLRMILGDPEALTYLGLLDNTLLDFHSGKLTDVSPDYMAKRAEIDRDGLALIHRYHPDELKGENWITYQVMDWYFQQNLRGHRFEYHWVANSVFMGPYPANHVYGVPIDLINFLSTYHKIRGRRSVRRYLQRLRMVDWKLTGLVESLQAREENQVIPPRFVIERTLDQVDLFINSPLEENPLFVSLLNRMKKSGRFTEKTQARWGKRVLEALEEEVVPAFRKFREYYQGLLDQTTEGDGVWRLPDGRDYYQFLLRNHTTTEMTPGEVHQLGLEEVARLTKEIRYALEKLGLPAENPGSQLKNMMADPQYHYPVDDGRRERIISDYQAILDEVNQRMPDLFNYGALDEIVVKRLPEYKEPDSPIAYAQAPALDGSRPGTMWINLRDPDNVYHWGMRTLAYHEGIPGHVYQMTQAQKLKGIPYFRRSFFFNAYIEGWALYAERLGWELGLEDEASNLGRLQALLWRAARLVVDTGIHTQHWSREKAIAYMVEKTGLPERDVVTEVERYIVAPGQACAYYLGYLRMLALRQKAEATLGEDFSLKTFHDVIIRHGGLPLTLLEEVVNDYLDQKAGLKPLEQG